MTRALGQLIDALYRSMLVDQFAVVEQVSAGVDVCFTQGARASAVARDEREWHENTLDIALYRDLENGRGNARIRLNQEHVLDQDQSWQQRVADWAERATVTLESPWNLPPPAAPARVDIADPALAADLHAGAEAVMSQLRSLAERAAGEPLQVRDARVECRADQVEVRTSHDFRHAYQATTVCVEFAVARAARLAAGEGPHSVERVRVCARRPADLALTQVIGRAATRLSSRAHASPLPAGVYDLMLERDALTPQRVSTTSADAGSPLAGRGPGANPRYAWFAPLVAHADSRWARHGLTRYQPGQSIYNSRAGGQGGDRPRTGDPLTVICDNTLPHALYSRPLGDLGAPSRRFALVRDGVAEGFALDLREAALRGLPANGGIGNLQIGLGPSRESELARPGARPLVRVTAIDHLDIDPPSGAFIAAIGLGYLSSAGDRGGASSNAQPGQPVTGGVIRGNIFDLLAGAKFSSTPHVSGWYHGPSAIRLSELAIA